MKTRLSCYTTAYCPHCNSNRAIYSKGVTPCPVCGKILLPCSACQMCLYDSCPYDGQTDEGLRVNANLPIRKEKAEIIIRLFEYRDRIVNKWLRCKSWWFRVTHKKEMNEEWLPF